MAGSAEMRKTGTGSKKGSGGVSKRRGPRPVPEKQSKGPPMANSRKIRPDRRSGTKTEKTCKTEDEAGKEKEKDKKKKESEEAKDTKETKDAKDSKDIKELKEDKEARDQKGPGKDFKTSGKDFKTSGKDFKDKPSRKDPKLTKPYKKTKRPKDNNDKPKTDGAVTAHCTCPSSTSCTCGSQTASDASAGKLKKSEVPQTPPLPMADDDMAPTEYESVENSRPFVSSVPKRKISFSEEDEFQKQLQEAYDNEKTAREPSESEKPPAISCYFNVYPAYGL
ncbi:unnamed protein product [Bursaphelenchus xylophilus]|uniref:(pine wood nematode) hypothetical protein n=1 Tax=Bursaphelenchus xylophilus TaxID=6326 RepID=A0A1I7SV39_BURXY|nr:unnamed protein product [Bursaphelenchus xylophilus]CAG9100858.1 unnamed protein product [Bursaphelenchus xylophilus]